MQRSNITVGNGGILNIYVSESAGSLAEKGVEVAATQTARAPKNSEPVAIKPIKSREMVEKPSINERSLLLQQQVTLSKEIQTLVQEYTKNIKPNLTVLGDNLEISLARTEELTHLNEQISAHYKKAVNAQKLFITASTQKPEAMPICFQAMQKACEQLKTDIQNYKELKAKTLQENSESIKTKLAADLEQKVSLANPIQAEQLSTLHEEILTSLDKIIKINVFLKIAYESKPEKIAQCFLALDEQTEIFKVSIKKYDYISKKVLTELNKELDELIKDLDATPPDLDISDIEELPGFPPSEEQSQLADLGDLLAKPIGPKPTNQQAPEAAPVDQPTPVATQTWGEWFSSWIPGRGIKK